MCIHKQDFLDILFVANIILFFLKSPEIIVICNYGKLLQR